MPPALAVTLLLPIAEALAAAHAVSVIHRDVKPENILLDAEGHPRIGDFGIARVGWAADTSLTRTGAQLGTWGYMAPEQRRDARTADARADIYGLGATLLALLTGAPPVDPFAWDVEADLGATPALAALVRDATRFELGARPPDMAAFRARLAAVQPTLPAAPRVQPRAGAGSLSGPRGRPGRHPHRTRRHRHRSPSRPPSWSRRPPPTRRPWERCCWMATFSASRCATPKARSPPGPLPPGTYDCA